GRAEVTHGGEPCVQRAARVLGRVLRLLRRPAEEAVHGIAVPARAGLEREMRVGVDQARKQRDVSEVDHLRPCWGRSADPRDALAVDHHQCRLDDGARPGVEHPGCFQRDGTGDEERDEQEHETSGPALVPHRTGGFDWNATSGCSARSIWCRCSWCWAELTPGCRRPHRGWTQRRVSRRWNRWCCSASCCSTIRCWPSCRSTFRWWATFPSFRRSAHWCWCRCSSRSRRSCCRPRRCPIGPSSTR